MQAVYEPVQVGELQDVAYARIGDEGSVRRMRREEQGRRREGTRSQDKKVSSVDASSEPHV